MGTILALDCSTEYCSVAVQLGDTAFSRDVHALHGHAEHLIDHAAALMKEAGIRLHECDAIAFGSGPGSFTGLRVACAVAQGLAFGSNRLLVPIGTLAALAERARRERADWPDEASVLCVQDARMGDVYWSVLDWRRGAWSERIAPSLSRPEEVAEHLGDAVGFACGSGLTACAALLGPTLGHPIELDHPGAVAIAALAREALARGQAVSPGAAHPLYVRDRVALTAGQRAAGEVLS